MSYYSVLVFASNTTVKSDFSLSILATNLNAEKETSLRTFLSKRLSRGMFVEGPGNGNVSSMDFWWVLEAVYYALVSKLVTVTVSHSFTA